MPSHRRAHDRRAKEGAIDQKHNRQQSEQRGGFIRPLVIAYKSRPMVPSVRIRGGLAPRCSVSARNSQAASMATPATTSVISHMGPMNTSASTSGAKMSAVRTRFIPALRIHRQGGAMNPRWLALSRRPFPLWSVEQSRASHDCSPNDFSNAASRILAPSTCRDQKLRMRNDN